jgi:predicted benzoate:H+ symporter BenE
MTLEGAESIPRGVALIARVEGATDKALRNTNLQSNAHVIVLITMAKVDI